MSLPREKILLGDDPLSVFAAPQPCVYSEEIQPLEEPEEIPVKNVPTVKDSRAFDADQDGKTKDSIAVGKSETNNLPISSSVVPAAKHAPSVTAAPAEDEDLFLPKPAAAQRSDNDDIFSFPATSSSAAAQISPNVIRGVGDAEDDLISDLNVAKLLEREENQDFALFGKTGVSAQQQQQQRAAKKKMDLDQEDDFLRQLDEITSSSSKRKDNSAAANNKSAAATLSFANTVPQTQNLDLDALNLNDYISQNSSSGGGLFD